MISGDIVSFLLPSPAVKQSKVKIVRPNSLLDISSSSNRSFLGVSPKRKKQLTCHTWTLLVIQALDRFSSLNQLVSSDDPER